MCHVQHPTPLVLCVNSGRRLGSPAVLLAGAGVATIRVLRSGEGRHVAQSLEDRTA
jgi:hypothetical protein